jgi:hypothetical protein
MERGVCRPATLTCRWIREITEAICMICPNVKPVTQCQTSEMEACWSKYLQRLSQDDCASNHPVVTSILNFQMDYNDVRCQPHASER